jgi:hypothetical protein
MSCAAIRWPSTTCRRIQFSGTGCLPFRDSVVFGRARRVPSQAANKMVPRRSPMILHGVYVLIALALGEYWAIDRSTDPKWKLQFTVF